MIKWLLILKLISHRGNLNGPDIHLENKEEYIQSAIEKGYFVEIDLWFLENSFFLGHDYPTFKTNKQFLDSEFLFIHCKNGESLLKMLELNLKSEFFWHQHDDYILTSKNNIWVEPGKFLLRNSICCLPEKGYVGDLTNCYGICSDYIENYKNLT